MKKNCLINQNQYCRICMFHTQGSFLGKILRFAHLLAKNLNEICSVGEEISC